MVRLSGMKAGLAGVAGLLALALAAGCGSGVAGLLALALVAGCGSGVADSSVAAARAPASRPVVTHAELTEAATGTTRFGLDVFGRLAGGNGNVVMSPASLGTVLAMLLPGTRGATAAAIAKVLHDQLP